MLRTKKDKMTCLGAALLVQLTLHIIRGGLLDAVSPRMVNSLLLSYIYGVITLVLKLSVFLIPVAVYLRLSGTRLNTLLAPVENKKTEGVSSPRRAIQFAVAASITVNAVNLAGMATEGICKALGIAVTPSVLPDDGVLVVISFLSSVILAPLLEELLFRGVMLNALSPLKKGDIILCGLLFALMHCSAYPLLYAFVAGCLIAFFTKKTNSLKVAVGIHFINNLLTFVSLAFGFYVSEAARNIFGYLLMAVTVPLAVFGIVMLIKERRAAAEHPAERSKGNEPMPVLILVYTVISAMICFR